MGPDGLVTSLFVFVVLPSFPCPPTNSLNKIKRSNYLKMARADMERMFSEKRLRNAFTSKLPPEKKHLMQSGDQV